MTKKGLLLLDTLLWSFASFKILNKGIPAIIAHHGWVVIVLAIVVLAGFIMMFNKVSDKYRDRILSLEGEKFPFYKFMPLKGYILIAFMMSLGIIAAHIPGMPPEFFAAFYPGLGCGLAFGALKYLIAIFK